MTYSINLKEQETTTHGSGVPEGPTYTRTAGFKSLMLIQGLVGLYYDLTESWEVNPRCTAQVLYLVGALSGNWAQLEGPLDDDLRALLTENYSKDSTIWKYIKAV